MTDHAGTTRPVGRTPPPPPPAKIDAMFSRFTLYFDEVARSGSLRRAAERLNISPSAIDRHILLMEENMGVALFERLPQGLRLTTAGEVLIANVRRWRRELSHAKAQIDDLQGLRRGEITLALVEGANDFAAEMLVDFKRRYPGIELSFLATDAKGVTDRLLDGRADLGLVFNPPDLSSIRVERTLVYQLGAVIPPDDPLAAQDEVDFAECVDRGLVIPDESTTLRTVIDTIWTRTVGGRVTASFRANSVALIKSLVLKGAGVGLLTPLDARNEIASGTLVYRPLRASKVPLSVLSLITAGGRSPSITASMLVQHIAQAMRDLDHGGA